MLALQRKKDPEIRRKMQKLTKELSEQFRKSEELEAEIKS